MRKEFNTSEFIREVYLESEPSVDIEKAEKINCTDHKMSVAKWDELVDKFCGDNIALRIHCKMWCLNQGPSIYNE